MKLGKNPFTPKNVPLSLFGLPNQERTCLVLTPTGKTPVLPVMAGRVPPCSLVSPSRKSEQEVCNQETPFFMEWEAGQDSS